MTAHLQFCVIGGRAFGKTQLLTSLVRIAGTTDGVVMPVTHSKNLLDMQAILDAGDNLAGTSWRDVKDFTFRIVKEAGAGQNEASSDKRSWDVSFTDYPGEEFEKYIHSEDGDSGNTDDETVMDSQTARDARKLMRRMESSDGLIILLPRNISDYQDTLRIYRSQMGAFLTKMLDRRPNLPVCLAINKWDMFDEPESKLGNLLSTDQTFSDIYNTVRGLCKNFFHLPISAFGKHDKDDSGKWDRASKCPPINVLEMLFELSSRAEENRIEELTSGWNGASGFAKAALWPWKASSVCLGGFSLEDNRQKAASVCRKAFARFLGGAAALLFAAFSIWTATCAGREFRRFSDSNLKLTAYEGQQFPNLDKTKLSKIKRSLADVSWVDRAFFAAMQSTLRERRNALESRFNANVYSNLLVTLDDDNHKDKNAWELSTNDRRMRSNDREKIISFERSRLTDDSTQLGDCAALMEREESFRERLREDAPFNDDLSLALKRPEHISESDWNHRLPRLIKGIQDKHSDKRESNGEDWEKLERLLSQSETASSNELVGVLANVATAYPASDWRSLVFRNAAMTNIIHNDREWFAESSPVLSMFEDQAAALAATNAYWLHYGPFDDDADRLRQMPESGKILAIVRFLDEHKPKTFPLRSEVLNGFSNDRDARIATVVATFNKDSEPYKDDKANSYAVRVSNAKRRMEEADRALKELPSRQQEYKAISAIRSDADKFVRENMENVAFEGIAKQELDNGSIRSIWSVLRNPKWKDEPAYADYSVKLKEHVNNLESQRRISLEKKLSDDGLQDNPDADMEERIRRKNQRVGLYDEALQDFAENTAAFASALHSKEVERLWIDNHQIYVRFDQNLASVSKGGARARELEAFLTDHTDAGYPEYANRLANLRMELARLTKDAEADLEGHIKNDRDASRGFSWKAQVEKAKDRVAFLKERKQALPESIAAWADKLVREEESFIEETSRQGLFSDAYQTILDNSDTNQWLMAIDGFRHRFPADGYRERTNEFAVLKQRRSAAEEAFKREYRNFSEITQKPKPRDYSAWSLYHGDLANKAQEIGRRCPTNSPLFVFFGTTAQNERRESVVCAKWSEVQCRAEIIEAESRKDDADVRTVLLLVQGFLRDFSRANDDVYARAELGREYLQVLGIQMEWEQKLAEQLNEKTEGCEASEQLALLDEYLPVFCPGSTLYETFKTKRSGLADRMSLKEEQDAYVLAAKRCLVRVDGAQLSAAEIVGTIERFFDENGEDNKGSSEAAGLIDQLKTKLVGARKQKLWQELSARAVGLVDRDIPNTDNVKELLQLKTDCTREKARLSNLDDSRKIVLIGQLEALIRKIETRIGDGSFKKIEEAEKAYKLNPSEKTFKQFSDLLDSFDPDQPGNSDKVAKVEEKRKDLNEDRRLVNLLKKTYKGFLSRPSRNSFIEFTASFDKLVTFNEPTQNKQGYGAQHKEIEESRRYIRQVDGLYTMNCSWVYFDLRDSNYRNVRTQKYQHFKVSVNGTLLYEKEGVPLDDKMEYGDPRRMEGNLKQGSDFQPFAICLFDGIRRFENLEFTIVDEKRLATITGNQTIDKYEILASGHSLGQCQKTLSIKGSENWSSPTYGTPTRYATFTFEFSGIPTLTLE